ncbi:MAG: DUF3526 domain-containing protein, partial [Deltaproteobacteria bacterium]|nr:DUF3526 domain-containing protein [Deltaproteobacteria bacterium]
RESLPPARSAPREAESSTGPETPRRGARPAGSYVARAVRSLVVKELREVSRDGRFWTVGVLIAALLATALAFGYRQAAAVRAERSAAQAEADEHWREQGERNPHVAAHYGTYVFKPAGPLPFVDPGVELYTGASVRIEAHRRNVAEGARARDGAALARFGQLSVASVLQLLAPLLVVGLGFAAWTAERERGTLRQLLGLGVAPGVLFVGKALGLAVALGMLLVPALVLGTATTLALAGGGDEAPGAPGAPRAIAMAAAYAVYLGAFLAVTLYVSALAPSSRVALVGLLGFWVVTSLVIPRAASDLVARVAPAPTHAELAAAIRRSTERGLPGGPSRDERVNAITEALLERHGFAGSELLMDPALLASIELRAEAAFENEVIDHHFGEHVRGVERQEQWVQWASVLSPFVAIRSLSMAFAGTDYAHHRHFADAAESHRRALVEMLDREIGERGGTDAWSYRAGRELWERAPALRYEPPDLGWVLARQAPSAGVLFAWLGVALLASWRTVSRLRVV